MAVKVSLIVDRTYVLHVGDDVEITVEVRSGSELIAPSPGVYMHVQSPAQASAGTWTTYTVGTDPEFGAVGTGVFRATIPCTEAGSWLVKAVSPGPTGKGAEITRFVVAPDGFDMGSGDGSGDPVVGEVNTITNVGGGAEVYKEKVGVDFKLRTMVGAGGIEVSEDEQTILIDGSGIDGGGGDGEANTASNVGDGAGIFKQKILADLEFRGIKGVDPIEATVNGDNVEVALTGSVPVNNQAVPGVDTLCVFVDGTEYGVASGYAYDKTFGVLSVPGAISVGFNTPTAGLIRLGDFNGPLIVFGTSSVPMLSYDSGTFVFGDLSTPTVHVGASVVFQAPTISFEAGGWSAGHIDENRVAFALPVGGWADLGEPFKFAETELTFVDDTYTLDSSEYEFVYLTLVGTPGGPATLVLPEAGTFNVRNDTDEDVTCAVESGTGVTLAPGQSAWIKYNATLGDWELRSELGGVGGGGAPTTAQYVTLATDMTLSNERVLTGSDNISVTDNGPEGSVVIAVTGAIPGANMQAASGSNAGSMSSADKTKLDALQPSVVTTMSALDIDWSLGTHFKKSLAAGANSITFSNMVAGRTILVELTSHASGSTVSWPGSGVTTWPDDGAEPSQSTPSKVDVWTFTSFDGTTARGSKLPSFAAP